MPKFRVKWEYDEYPDLSYLDQWNTPEKYYGEAPKCSHGSPMKYVGNHEWSSYCYACEDAGKDESATFDGHGSTKGGPIVDVDGKHGGLGEHKLVPFEAYMRYYGDPNRHVTLEVVVEKQCEHCQSWTHAASCGGVDFMDDDRDATSHSTTRRSF